MKKRIVGFLLVVVMLVLSLASCGYNYSKDNLADYGALNKTDFEAALQSLKIEDGDFTSDPTTRQNKVHDAILKEFATKAGTTDKKTEGSVVAPDVLYYCYYVTAVKDGVEYMFVSDFLTSSSTSTISEKSIQLGLKTPEKIDAKIIEAFAEAAAAGEFKIEDYAYTKVTTDDEDTAEIDESKVKAGDIVYINYTSSYKVTEADGKEKTVDEKATKLRVVLDAANPFHKAVIDEIAKDGKKVTSAISELKVNEEGKGDVTYTNISIDWVEKGKELTTYTEKTYTTATSKTDVYGKSVDLNGIELTYHIYPVSYIDVEEVNATNIINVLFGSGITYTTVCQVLFGYDVFEQKDGETDEQYDERIENLANDYKFAEEEGSDKTLDLETFIESLANLQKTYETEKKDKTTAETELKKAKTDLETAIKAVLDKATDDQKAALTAAEAALEAAKKAVADAGEAATDAQKQAVTDATNKYNEAKTAAYANATDNERGKVTTAENAVPVAETALDEAVKNYNLAKEPRDKKVAAFFAVKEGMEATLTKGYEDYTYEKLEAEYNKEIKMNLAKEVYALLEKYVSVTEDKLPEKAVDEAFDQLMENYEYAFYNNQTLENDTAGEEGEASNKDQSYYALYKGSFKTFIIKCVVPNEYKKTVETYAEAKEVIRNEGAKKMVLPVLRVYVASEAYDLIIDDKEFKERADEDSNYIVNEAYYGKNTVRNTYQFDDLMNYILSNTETNKADDAKFTVVEYTKVKYEFKPAE